MECLPIGWLVDCGDQLLFLYATGPYARSQSYATGRCMSQHLTWIALEWILLHDRMFCYAFEGVRHSTCAWSSRLIFKSISLIV